SDTTTPPPCGVAARPTKAPASLDEFASPLDAVESCVRLSATMEADPPGAVTAPMTCPATPSPVVADDVCVVVSVLFPFWRFWQLKAFTPPGHAAVTSPTETPAVLDGTATRPTTEEALLLPRASPEETLEFAEVLRASTDVRPDDTTPETCPPTAAPLPP